MHDVIEDSTYIEMIKEYFVYYIWVKSLSAKKSLNLYLFEFWQKVGFTQILVNKMVFNMSNKKLGQIISTIKYTRLFVSSYYIF